MAQLSVALEAAAAVAPVAGAEAVSEPLEPDLLERLRELGYLE